MKRQRKVSKRLEATAYHEAGHAVAGVMLGVEFTVLSIVARGNKLGRVDFGPFRRRHAVQIRQVRSWTPEMQGYARSRQDRFVTVVLAGPCAHRHFTPRGCWRQGGSSDIERAMEMLERQADGNRMMATAHFRLLWRRAEAVVNTYWVTIDAVAKAALEHRRLSHQDVLQAMMDAHPAWLKSSHGPRAG